MGQFNRRVTWAAVAYEEWHENYLSRAELTLGLSEEAVEHAQRAFKPSFA